MTKRFDHGIFLCDLCRSFFVAVKLAALAAGPVFDISVLRAGRFISLGLTECMALRGDHCIICGYLLGPFFVAEHFPALAAGPVFDISVLRAGSFLRFGLAERMRCLFDRAGRTFLDLIAD